MKAEKDKLKKLKDMSKKDMKCLYKKNNNNNSGLSNSVISQNQSIRKDRNLI